MLEKIETKEDVLKKEEIILRDKAEVIYNEYLNNSSVREPLYILDGLGEKYKNEFPNGLPYHHKAHTLDVIKETIFFILASGHKNKEIVNGVLELNDEAIFEQQIITAAWHDVGFMERKQTNESIAVQMFRTSNAYKNLTIEQIKQIELNILETELVFANGYLKQNIDVNNKEKNSKYKYILDADVANFGRMDFFEMNERVAQELGKDLTIPEVRKDYYKMTIDLLANHTWQTPGAQKFYENQQQKNLLELKRRYAILNAL